MGYDSLPDHTEDDFDISLVRKQFPSIILGSSPELELYDGTKNSCEMRSFLAIQEDFLSNFIGEEQEGVSVDKRWHSLDSTLPSVKTHSSREDYSNTLPISQQPMPLITYQKSNQPVTSEETIRLGSQTDAMSIELLLDRSINCLPGLSKKHCRQLENCGFHTVGFA